MYNQVDGFCGTMLQGLGGDSRERGLVEKQVHVGKDVLREMVDLDSLLR